MMMFSEHDTFLYSTEKVDRELNSGETEREREREGERASVAANGLWAITLTIRQIFITARLNIILDLIKMNIKIIHNNLDGYYFSRCCAFSSIRQTTDIFH